MGWKKGKRRFAKTSRRHVPGKMNGLETKFSLYLEDLKMNKKIEWWRFEPIRLKLTDFGNTTHYTPDFLVLENSGEMTVYESKGMWTSSARVKTKTAADRFFFWRFIGVKSIPKTKGGGWEFEEFEPKEEK